MFGSLVSGPALVGGRASAEPSSISYTMLHLAILAMKSPALEPQGARSHQHHQPSVESRKRPVIGVAPVVSGRGADRRAALGAMEPPLRVPKMAVFLAGGHQAELSYDRTKHLNTVYSSAVTCWHASFDVAFGPSSTLIIPQRTIEQPSILTILQAPMSHQLTMNELLTITINQASS